MIIHATHTQPLMDLALFCTPSLEIDNYSAEEPNLSRSPTFPLKRNERGVTCM